MACRDCKLLDVPLDKAGRRMPRKGKAYRCLAEVPTVPLPRSWRGHWRWTTKASVYVGYMEPDEGDNCFYHEKVK